jgi:murein DD-endopeptidase MepM/ murein hydrolase activator NlpD
MFQRRPSGPATPTVSRRPGSRRPVAGRPARPVRGVLVVVLAGATLLGTAAPAAAVPPPPPNPTDGQLGAARAEQDAAAAEVGRIRGLVAAAEAELEKAGVLAEAAGTAYMMAEEALTQAQEAAERTAADLHAAADAVAASEARIALFSRDSYMQGSAMSATAALLDSAGPGELIQRAAMLDYVADNQLDLLGELEVAKVAQANADSAARAARDEMAAAEAAAESAKRAADDQLAAQQGAYERVASEKAAYEQQLQAAQIHLYELQGARDAYQQWVAQREAEEAAAKAAAEKAARDAADAAAAAAQRSSSGSSGGGGGGRGGGMVTGGGSGGSGDYVAPASGRVSSCYGARWGVTHFGVDIANSIGTPIYAATSGVVRRAGPATGFGQAVYILGDDGYVTVYGHVNRYFVSTGERVSAGEQIAEVGNRGQSTGPHLHFEVHSGGQLYSNQMNPVPWLNARGVYLGGCGG